MSSRAARARSRAAPALAVASEPAGAAQSRCPIRTARARSRYAAIGARDSRHRYLWSAGFQKSGATTVAIGHLRLPPPASADGATEAMESDGPGALACMLCDLLQGRCPGIGWS